MLSFDEFKKLDIRVATILAAERVAGSEKLVQLTLDDGTPDGRTIVAGIGKAYDPPALVGRQIAVVANLEPRTFTLRHGSGQVVLESNGMLLAAHGEAGAPVLLGVDAPVPPGSVIS
ncbi:MAG: methionine--tRNA ligase [bacterium]|nr:methionine--tRNA ligase [bacterium]